MRSKALTKMRSKAQREGHPPLFYQRQTCVATCDNSVAMATGVS